MIFPVILYNCETWTKTIAIEKTIDACEMWIWRRMLMVSWTEKRTNESKLMEIGHARGDMSLKQSSKIEVGVLWPCDESKWYGKGYDAGIRRGKKKKKPSDEEVDRGNTHDVRDESGGALGMRWRIGTSGEN